MPPAISAVRGNTLFAVGLNEGIPVGSAAWIAWLEAPETNSFRFESGTDGFTARRERRRGGLYWYAYRKCMGRLRKAYLGRAAELSPDRLGAIATELARPGRDAPAAPQTHGAPVSGPVRRHNLPLQPTSFVGREQALAEVRRVLETTRLLTLTGAGGVGKTRLALEAAVSVADTYPDGVWLVELAPVADLHLVPHAVATVLGVREQPERSLPVSLAEALRTRRLLLVLDNCEHLLAACAELADMLLRACPELAMLTTSRAVLQVAGETTWRVPSLELPGASERETPDAQAGSEAVRLFVERARAARPGFALDQANGPAVADICRRLDGLPLAIELAAAQVRTLAPAQIAQRLDHALGLLVTGPRTAPARLQTLRAALDWSYALVGEPERRLFERISVFAGGWTLEAAEAVGTGSGLETADVLDALRRLVDQSMVVAEPRANEAAVRFRLLEPLRQYAAERLASRGETEQVHGRHATHYGALVEQLGTVAWGPDCVGRRAQLEREYENVRAALRWLIGRGEAEHAQRLGGLLMSFWQLTGRAGEGRAWLDEVLSLPGGMDKTPARVRALNAAGRLATELGDFRAATPLLEEALALARELGDRPGTVEVLNELALVALFRREFARARTCATESLTLSQATGQRAMEGLSCHVLAEAAYQLDDPAAGALAERAIAVLIEAEFPSVTSVALRTLGTVHVRRGDFATARALFEQALAAHPPDVVELNRLGILVQLGRVATEQGDFAGAKERFVQALNMAHQAFGRVRLVLPLEGLAQVAAAAGQPSRALRLAGAAAALRETHTIRLTPIEHAQLERWRVRAGAAVGQLAAEAAWSSGQHLTPEQAVAEALAVDVVQRMGRSATAPFLASLTVREQEVAVLVGEGLGTRQIAERLVITEATARVHIERILAKLGLHSRTQLVAWALQRRMAAPRLD